MNPDVLVVDDVLRRLKSHCALVKRMSPMIRVRRRGFPREVRRGFDVRRADGIYRVIRRSNHNLWLEKVYEPDGRPMVGDTIRVRTPKRYEGRQ